MKPKTLRSHLGASLALLLLVSSVCEVQARGVTRRVRFARGRTTAVLKNSVVRGDVDRYILGARAGQTMTVHITSRENNAVFNLQTPGGKSLEGAGEVTTRLIGAANCRSPAITLSKSAAHAATRLTHSKWRSADDRQICS